MRLCCLLVFVIGCTGEITSTGPGNSEGFGPDAATAMIDAASSSFACRTKVTAGLSSGEHNPGQDCQSACHNHDFTLSGTVFTGANSTTPVVGATITVKDANGQMFDMPTHQNGNFYTKLTVAFPVTVVASSCPDVRPMVSTIAAGNGGCNKGGCHIAGATGKVFLP